MRFKVDENLPDDVAAFLRNEGHDTETVHSEGLRGCDDTLIAEHCRSERRAIVTLDLDFADIRTYPPSSQAGLIVLRVADQSRRHVMEVLARVAGLLKTQPIDGRLWVVSEASVRIRGD